MFRQRPQLMNQTTIRKCIHHQICKCDLPAVTWLLTLNIVNQVASNVVPLSKSFRLFDRADVGQFGDDVHSKIRSVNIRRSQRFLGGFGHFPLWANGKQTLQELSTYSTRSKWGDRHLHLYDSYDIRRKSWLERVACLERQCNGRDPFKYWKRAHSNQGWHS